MKKLIFSFIVFMCGMSVWASPNSIVKHAINKAEISKTALIGVSFKDVNSKKDVVTYNSMLPMSAASVQKVVTTVYDINKVGVDYQLKTQLFKDKNNNVYLKLGADPYFTSGILNDMIKNLKMECINKFYIDDSVVDRIEWGEGWQWDNTLNTYMPKFSAYNIDSNLISFVVRPTKKNMMAEIYPLVFYPLVFKNDVITGYNNNLKFFSQDYMKPDFIEVSGTVNSKVVKQIPVNDLKKYFILRIKDALRENKIAYYGKYEYKKVPSDAVLVAQTVTPVEKLIVDILQNSNNVTAETLFKIVGDGTTDSSIKDLEKYYTDRNINVDSIKLTDASGVSKNNLMTADFIANVLLDNYFQEHPIKSYMAIPGVGTLSNRMFYLKGKLIAKTGTLQNVSALAGYLTAESGKTYAFCIIINDAKSSSFDKKAFEEYVIRNAYETL